MFVRHGEPRLRPCLILSLLEAHAIRQKGLAALAGFRFVRPTHSNQLADRTTLPRAPDIRRQAEHRIQQQARRVLTILCFNQRHDERTKSDELVGITQEVVARHQLPARDQVPKLVGIACLGPHIEDCGARDLQVLVEEVPRGERTRSQLG